MKWSSLKHNGICLTPPYDYRGPSIKIRNKTLKLKPEQEEMAYAWAKKIGTPYVQDPVSAQNFLKDFAPLLPVEYADVKIDEIDFSEILKQIERGKNISKEEKKRLSAERKAKRTQLKERFGYAEVDGIKTEVANWMVEPPGIFMGRGAHPLRGRWKPRVQADEITLNLSEDAPVPPGNWKEIIHNHDFMWLASWFDNLTEKRKYVWLSEASLLRQKRDKEKYELAARLDGNFDRMRRFIDKGLRARDEKTRKIATVCFLIDRLAMRVGDEKDEDEADTVGASTLRVEHVKLLDHEIRFDFLGKDSVRWEKSLKLDNSTSIMSENLRKFMEGKKDNDPLFDGINSSAVNRFLSKNMKGLTAKVLRTFHATATIKQYLTEHSKLDKNASTHSKLYQAKLANLEAAINCNHKRTPPKNWEQSLAKKEETLQRLQTANPKTEKQAERLKERIEKLRLTIDLAKKTRDYNLTTSLKNYIDPRVYKAWTDHVGLDWRLLYTKSLQKKISWVSRSRVPWRSDSS